MKRWLAALERYWFAPSDQHDLGVFRTLLGAWLLLAWFSRLAPRSWALLARPPELALPVGFVATLGLPVPAPEWFLSLAAWLFPGACLLLVLGLFSRAALLVLTPLYLYLEGALNSWGYTSHSSMLPALALVVLCGAPGVHAFSLVEYLRRRREPSRPRARGLDSVWPVRLMLVLVATLYFSSGLSKLRHGGVAWLDGETLGFYLSGGSVRDSGQMQQFFADPSLAAPARFRDGFGLVDYAWVARPTELASWLATEPWLLQLLSVATLALELGFPLALLSRRLMFAFLLAATLFHVSVLALMRIDFSAYLLSYTLFVDWAALRRAVARSRGATSS